MTKISNNIELSKIFEEVLTKCENIFKTQLCVDIDVLKEIEVKVESTLHHFKMDRPNVAKIASSFAFWIRKLKPIYHCPEVKNKFIAINELVGILVALSVCATYYDDYSRPGGPLSFPSRIFTDWITSLRYNAHSPYSTVISFELLTSAR